MRKDRTVTLREGLAMREELYRYLPMLCRCEIFRGLDADCLADILGEMDARLADFDRGDAIYRCGDMVRLVAIVLEGAVTVGDEDVDGGSINISMLEPGDELGAYLVVSGKQRSAMCVYAAARCRLMLFDLEKLLRREMPGEAQWRITNNLLHEFAGKCLDLYHKAAIYGKRRIRSRLRMYLMSLETVDDMVVLPMNRTELAAWLGVDRAALARELGRMQAEGLVAVDRRRIRLLNRDYFQLDPAEKEK